MTKVQISRSNREQIAARCSAIALLAGFGIVLTGCSEVDRTEQVAVTTQPLTLGGNPKPVPYGTNSGTGTKGWSFAVGEDYCKTIQGLTRLNGDQYMGTMMNHLLRSFRSASKLEFWQTGGTCGGIQQDGNISYTDFDVPGGQMASVTAEGRYPHIDFVAQHLTQNNPFTTIHEFGHALGFQHENNYLNNPSAYNTSVTVNTAPDDNSVMYTLGASGPKLSFWDHVGVAAYYGRRVALLSPLATWCRGSGCYNTSTIYHVYDVSGADYATIAANRQEGELAGGTYVATSANGWLWDQQVTGTVALNLYLNSTTGDYLTSTSLNGVPSGYNLVDPVGYIYSSEQPGTIALNSYYNNNGEFLTTANTNVQTLAVKAGYTPLRTEGYVFNTDRPYRLLNSFTRTDRDNNGNPSAYYFVATAVDETADQSLLEDTLLANSYANTGTNCSSTGYCPAWDGPNGAAASMRIVLAYNVPGTIAFKTYYNSSNNTYFGCAASCATSATSVPSGYTFVQTEGYVFESDQFHYQGDDNSVSGAITRGISGLGGASDSNTIEGYGLVNEGAKGTPRSPSSSASYMMIRPYSVYTSNSLKLNDRVQVTSTQASSTILNAGTASTYIGVDAKVAGAVQSIASVDLRDRSNVTGFIESAGTVTIGNGVTHSAIASSTQVDSPNLNWFTGTLVRYPATSRGDVYLEPGQASANTTLTPGRQGTVMVKANTVLKLPAGTYYFDALYNQGQVSTDTSKGPVRIFIANTFIYTGKFVDLNSRITGDLFIGYFGSADVAINAAFNGTIVSPNAKLSLASVSAGYVGAFYAKDIEVHQDSVVTHRAFPYSWVP